MSNPEEIGGKVARPYQLRLMEHAIKHNSIIYLPTGSGKTYIAIMLIRHFSKDLQKPISEGGKRCIFLCNTVALARQNVREISTATNFKVGLFTGDMNVDFWPPEKWNEEINGNQVYVGTSQVFVDMVSHKYLSITDLSCVVMDECHHATKSHPMHQFLSFFLSADQTKLPRVVGLTGVLLKSSKKGDILSPLQDLEAVFRGKIITVENFDEFHNVLLYSTKPNEIMIPYSSIPCSFDIEAQIKSIIENSFTQIKNFDMGEQSKYSKNLQAVREPSKLKAVKLLLSDFCYQMDDMGLYAASVAILCLIVQFEINKRNSETIMLRNMYRYIITQCEHIRHILIKKIKSFSIDDDDDDDDLNEADVILNFSKPKVQALLAFFKKEFRSKKMDDISCLVFVKRRYTAKCLYYVIKHFVTAYNDLSHIIPEFMVGRNTAMLYSIDCVLDSKWNRKAIDRFRHKECNLIVCSSVLEEGIDVQACNYVISFDQINQFSSYVQMKGRARSRESTYAVVCEEQKVNEVTQKIQAYRKIDDLLKNYLIARVIDREIPDESQTLEQFAEIIPPFVAPSGAILQAQSAIMLLHRYCQTLPNDSFTQVGAIWSIVSQNTDGMQVSLQLPMQSSIKDIIYSDVMKTCKWAKVSAAFKACLKLYENGELSEILLPVTRKQIVENVSACYFDKWNNETNESTEAGTRKNHRVYKKLYPKELIGAQPIPGKIAYAYCITIDPKFSLNENNAHIIQLLNSNSNYAIILKHKLPALAPMPLFMTQGPLNAKISSTPFEFVIADDDELMKLKWFHKMVFTDIRDLWKNFLVIDSQIDSPNSFLIAPVQNNCAIDWKLVRDFQQLSIARATTEVERKGKKYSPEDFIGKIVRTWYSADEDIRYVVTKIREDLTPLSAFTSSRYTNFAHYVESKYDVKVQNKEQFLIEAQALTSRTNFFVNAAGKTTESKRSKQDNTVILIPEMCHNYRFPGDLWLKALFLPCILHRCHFLLNAETLRVDINRFLGIKDRPTYQPAPIEIDHSLRRVGSDKPHEHRSLLPALETTRRDNSSKQFGNIIDLDEGNWKSYIEPIDVHRNTCSLYPIEVDYYYEFVNHLLDDMKELSLDEAINSQVSRHNLEAYKPKIECHYDDVLSKKIADVSFDPGRGISILSDHINPSALKSGEQFEFLAAITTGATNDVFDMERFEVLGDSFLKFSTSLLLMHRHPKWNEGFLTAIKSRMVSNRNLLYCMRSKYNGSFICSSTFEPSSEWLPPSAVVPANIQHAIIHGGVSAKCLYDLKLTDKEIKSGICSENTLESVRTSNCMSETSPESPSDCLNEFLYKQSVADKVLADCLEALLGVCVKNYGVQKSFEMLDYFQIYNDSEKVLLPKLLQINLGTPLVRANIKQSEVDAYLLNYEFLEANLQYKFNDRAYLLQAVTHASYPTNRLTGCYQQLEFIGDAILDFLISCYIFERCKHMNPGEITDLRSALVNNVTLACICVRNRFHQYMLYESPSLSESIRKFVEFQNTQDHRVTEQVKILLEESDSPEKFNMAQNIDVPKALGDVMEAIIGAIFLDSGNDLRRTWHVISQLMDIELNDFMSEVPINPVRQLYEYRGANPTFDINCVEIDVVMVKCTFYCRDLVKTVMGCGGNKLMAKKAAAKMALQILHTS